MHLEHCLVVFLFSNLLAHAVALGFNCAVLGEKARLWPDTQQSQ